MSIAFGGIIAFVFRGMNLVVALAMLLLVSRELSEAQSDAFILGITIVGLTNSICGGLTAAAAFQVSNQRRQPGEALAAGGIPASALAALAVILGVLVGAAATGQTADLALPVGLGAAAVVINALIGGVFLGREAFIRYNGTLVLPPLLALVAIAIALFAADAGSAEALLAAYAAGQWAGVVLMVLTGLPLLTAGFRLALPLARRMVRFAGLAAISGAASYLNYRANLFVVAYFEGDGGVSTYGFAAYVGESIWQVSGSLALATYARLGSLSRPEAAALTTRVMRHTLLLLGVLCVVLFFAADLIQDILWPDYPGVASALRWLLPGLLIFGLAQSYSGFYTYQRGLPWVAALVAGMGLVINLAFALALVPPFGVDGAAAASSIAYSSAIIIALAVFVVQERLRPTDIFRFGRADLDDYRALFTRVRTTLG
ncbi:MAG: polysaccharide biosynthesis C-terminal domain-containing protein, partial [Tepidiformaceae bacterium]